MKNKTTLEQKQNALENMYYDLKMVERQLHRHFRDLLENNSISNEEFRFICNEIDTVLNIRRKMYYNIADELKYHLF